MIFTCGPAGVNILSAQVAGPGAQSSGRGRRQCRPALRRRGHGAVHERSAAARVQHARRRCAGHRGREVQNTSRALQAHARRKEAPRHRFPGCLRAGARDRWCETAPRKIGRLIAARVGLKIKRSRKLPSCSAELASRAQIRGLLSRRWTTSSRQRHTRPAPYRLCDNNEWVWSLFRGAADMVVDKSGACRYPRDWVGRRRIAPHNTTGCKTIFGIVISCCVGPIDWSALRWC